MMQSDVRFLHEKEGVRLSREVLANTGWPEPVIAAVGEIIDGHDTRPYPRSLNDRLVRDADKLWRFTVTGVAVACDWFKLNPRQYADRLDGQFALLETEAGRQMATQELASDQAGPDASFDLSAEQPMGELELGGKRVIVTGAAGGLGRAFAEAFAAAGASVVAADIDVAGAEETARLIAAKGGRALPQAVDVTDLASAERLARVAHEGLGGADVLVNNAAVYAGLQRTSFESISEAEWDRVMSVNVKGTWIMTRAVAPLLRASGGGAIVNVSSATVMSGSPMWLHYVSSKGAIIAMTRALARELGDDNVTVNAIAPGLTLTGASLGLVDNAAEYGVMRGALKRAAVSGDIVGAVLFLASPHATFVTGQTLVVDGGRQFL